MKRKNSINVGGFQATKLTKRGKDQHTGAFVKALRIYEKIFVIQVLEI